MLISGKGNKTSPCVFLLGGFDGLHIGHKKLLDHAKNYPYPTVIMTIDGGKGKKLFTLPEREKLFLDNGITETLPYSFTEEFKNTLPEKFIQDILKEREVVAFVCGEDFRFGKDALGTPKFIKESTAIPVETQDILTVNGKKVSASDLKEYIKQGEIKKANRLLLTPFFVMGSVQEGRKVGRKIGFPTANIFYPKEKIKLKEGVYAVHTFLNGKRYNGIANQGACPTFGVTESKVEAHFDGFDGDLYGKEICVYFDGFLREVKPFENAQSLVEQLKKDLSRVRKGDF